MSLEKITTTNIWMRLVNTEYDNLNSKELELKFKSIYLEETGELYEGDISIYHSSESEVTSKLNSGYDGTALLLSNNNEEKLYVINQGTTNLADWKENIKGPFAGKSEKQAEATRTFVDDTKRNFGVGDGVETISLGHSLGHHNSSMTGISDDTFDEIYGVNGLQISPVEAYNYDFNFYDAVNVHFGLRGKNDIYEIPTNELAEFTKEFYADAPVKIHQYISEDDPLYAVTEKAGFVTFGDVTKVDTKLETDGIKELVDDIPDDVIASFRDLAIDYADADNKGGVNEVVYQLLGVKMEYLEGIEGKADLLKWYAMHNDEVDETMRALKDNLPPLADKIRLISQNADTIFGRLYEAGYIDEEQKKVMIEEIGNLDEDLTKILGLINANVGVNEESWSVALGGDIATFLIGKEIAGSLTESIQNILDSGTLDSLKGIKDSHSINELLNAMTKGKKSYIGKDLIYTANAGGGEAIKVNMTAALKMYRKGAMLLDEKRTAIVRLEERLNEEIAISYREEKYKVLDGINHIEASPKSFAYERGWMHRYPLYEVESLVVDEHIEPLRNADMDEEVRELYKNVESGHMMLEDYRKAIEELFRKEEEVAQMFDLVRGF
jgi:hypothetical protein